MIQIADNLWIGDSADGRNLDALSIGAMLNVAQDLRGEVGWPDIEYMQVGLIDGPGNTQASYHSAVLALVTLLKRHKQVLVCCHTGSRSLAIALIYLHIIYRYDWNDQLEELAKQTPIPLPTPHEAHREAFNHMNWKLLSTMLEN